MAIFAPSNGIVKSVEIDSKFQRMLFDIKMLNSSLFLYIALFSLIILYKLSSIKLIINFNNSRYVNKFSTGLS